MSESTVTETANLENTENQDATENENSEDETVEAAPIFTRPKTIEDVIAKMPETAGLPIQAVIPTIGEMLKAMEDISDIVADLAAANQNKTDDEIIGIAANKSDEGLKKLMLSYNSKLAALEKVKKEVVEATKALLAETELSEDEIKAKEVLRKERLVTVTHFKGAIDQFKSNPVFVAPENVEYLDYLINEVHPVGVKGKGSVTTSGATSGYGKPRLNGGKVKVNGKEFASFPAAAAAIQGITNSPVSREDVIGAWCRSQSATSWTDIEFGYSEFTFQDGVKVGVEKFEKDKSE